MPKEGNTIEFMLSAKRDIPAAKRFFKKMMRANHRRLPFSISVDQHASYPEAFTISQEEEVLPKDCRLRRTKYLSSIIEQDHRFIRRRWRAMQCFHSFHTAERTLEGVETRHMMRKGQVKRLDGRDAVGRAKFIESLFTTGSLRKCAHKVFAPQNNLCNGTGICEGNSQSVWPSDGYQRSSFIWWVSKLLPLPC